MYNSAVVNTDMGYWADVPCWKSLNASNIQDYV